MMLHTLSETQYVSRKIEPVTMKANEALQHWQQPNAASTGVDNVRAEFFKFLVHISRIGTLHIFIL